MGFWLIIIIGVVIIAFVLGRLISGLKSTQIHLTTKIGREQKDSDTIDKIIFEITSDTAASGNADKIKEALEHIRRQTGVDSSEIVNISKTNTVVASKSYFTTANSISMREISISVKLSGIPARDGAKINISVSAGMKDNKTTIQAFRAGDEDFAEGISTLNSILMKRLAAVVAGCDKDEIFGNREAFAGIAKELLAKELAKDGIELVSFAIDDIKSIS